MKRKGGGAGGEEEATLRGALSWTSNRNKILVQGRAFRVKGINWFGFETPTNVVLGLSRKPLTTLLDWVVSHGLNALRVPFSVKLALELDQTVPSDADVRGDPTLQGLTSGAILDRLIDEAGARGLVVMLDQHRLDPNGEISELWYDETYTEDAVLRSWDAVMERYGRRWNVFAVDLKNENHGPATWGNGDTSCDWKLAAERIIHHIATRHPYFKGLFFVGGIWGGHGHWWGGNMRGVRRHPVRPGGDPELEKRVVYTPHCYGPSVYEQPYFESFRFPDDLTSIWNKHFGYMRRQQQRAVVVGEWGGHGDGKDGRWQKRFARYLRETDMADSFYWCLNPESGDTGGVLLEDWEQPNWDKLRILHELMPTPSRLEANGDGTFRYRLAVKPETQPPPAGASEKQAKCEIS